MKPSLSTTSQPDVEHVFVASNDHFLNEMRGFFDWLHRPAKRFFVGRVSPVPEGTESLEACARHAPRARRAVLYASRWSDVASIGLFEKYDAVRVVRLFHGAPQPSAWTFKERAPWDAVVASSVLGAGLWRSLAAGVRVVPVGWPKLEGFLESRAVVRWSPQHRILIGSSWDRHRCGIAHYSRLFCSTFVDRTWLVHPNLSNALAERARARVAEAEFNSLRDLAERHGVEVHDGSTSVLPVMEGAKLLFGAQSSTSLEWLIFDRPIIFLVHAEHLDFGPHIDDLTTDLQAIVDDPSRYDTPEHADRRAATRARLLSHVDGRGAARFNDLVAELEVALVSS